MARASLNRPLTFVLAGSMLIICLADARALSENALAQDAELSTSHQIAQQLRPGLRQLQVESILFRRRPGAGWRDESRLDGQQSRSRYALPDGSYLLVEFAHAHRETGTLGPDEIVTQVRVVKIDSLLPKSTAEQAASLIAIHYSPSIKGSSFDPAALIAAVNALQPLGKTAALERLRAYETLCQKASDQTKFDLDLDPQRLFLIARVLFEPTPPSQRSPLALGAASPGEGADPRDWPEFPLALQDDVPFCLCAGYALGGQAERPSEYLEEVEAHQLIRPTPLKPGSSPALAMSRLRQSIRWNRLFTTQSEADFCTYLLRLQVMRATVPITGVLQDDQFICGDCQGEEAATKNWNAYVDQHHLVDAIWSVTVERFVPGQTQPTTRPSR